MTKNFLLEPLADGMEIDEVDFMQRRDTLYSSPEFGEALRKECSGTRNSDINIGVWVSRTFWPRPEPDDLNISTQHGSNKLRDFLCNLSRSSEKLLRNHRVSVSVLAMMSTGFAGKLIENRKRCPEGVRRSVVVCQSMCFGVRLSQLSQVTVDVVGIATLGLQLNGHMFDAKVRSDPVLDQPE
jgi:hypothetical protein